MRRAHTLWAVLAVAAVLSLSAWSLAAETATTNAKPADEAPAPVATAAPAPAPVAVAETPALVAGEKKGLETQITRLSLREMDLTLALRALAEGAGINLAVGKDVEGKVTCNLNNVTARVALDIMVRSNECTYSDVGGVIIVLKQVPASAGGGQTAVAQPPPIKPVRAVLQLPYTGKEMSSVSTPGLTMQKESEEKVEEMVRKLLSSSGRLIYYERQHMIIVEDSEENVDMVKQFVAELWKVPQQVFIQSSLIEVSLGDEENLGFKWDTNLKVTGHGKIDQSTGAAGTYNGTLVTSGGPTLGLERFFSFGIVNSNLSAVLETIATRRRVDLRSNPSILVMNHRPATIVAGQEIPYLSSVESSTANPIRTYDFKEVAVRLGVTPHISDDGIIFLDVFPSVKSVIGYTDEPKQPILSTREAATNVAVADGSTLIIGGLVQRNSTRSYGQVPVLSQIPLLGWFFRQKATNDTKNDLLFLLSPKIVSREIMQEMLQERMDLTAEPAPHAGESPTFLPRW